MLAAAACVALSGATLARELSVEELTELERLLAELNFDPGKIDGVVDVRTRTAVGLYQEFAALPVDGAPSAKLLAELRQVVQAVVDMKAAQATARAEAAPPVVLETAPAVAEAPQPAAPAPVVLETPPPPAPEPAPKVAETPQPPAPEPEPEPEVAAPEPAPEVAETPQPAAPEPEPEVAETPQPPAPEPAPEVAETPQPPAPESEPEPEVTEAPQPAAPAPEPEPAPEVAETPQPPAPEPEPEPEVAETPQPAAPEAAPAPEAPAATETREAEAPASAAPAPEETKLRFDLGNMIARLVQPGGRVAAGAGNRADPGLVLAVQRHLARIGLDPGPLDGHAGAQTMRAVEAYQRARGLPVDGRSTRDLLARLEREPAGPAAPAQAPAARVPPAQVPPARAPAGGEAARDGTGERTSRAPPALKFPASSGPVTDGYDAFKKGYAAALARDFDLAIDFYTRAIEGGDLALTHLADAFFNRANARFYKGAIEFAIADYGSAIVNKPEFSSAYYNRGFALKAIGQRTRAQADSMRARALGLRRLGVRSPDVPPPRP